MDENLEKRLAELDAEESGTSTEKPIELDAEEPAAMAAPHAGWGLRQDPTAVAFGVGFVVVGLVGLARSAGLEFGNGGIYPVVLLGLGAAGLWSVLKRRGGR